MRPNLDQIRLQEPLFSHQWGISFVKIPIQGGEFALPGDFDLQCKSATLPTMRNSMVTTNIKQFTVKSPGISVPSGPIKLVFYEQLQLKMINFFYAWERSCSNPITGQLGNKKAKITDGSSLANIEAIISLNLLDYKNKSIFVYVLFGCMISSFNPGDLSSETAIVSPSVEIAYDYFVAEPVGVTAIADIVAGIVSNFGTAGDFIKNFGV